MNSSSTQGLRLRGNPATNRSQNFAGATVVVLLIGIASVGLFAGVAPIAFLAVGAGAGYSLSGSV